MRILRGCVVLGVLLAIPSQKARADRPWVEIQSPHFTVICNGSEKEGRDAAVDLERTRSVLMAAMPGVRQDPNVPIVVFVVVDENTFVDLVPLYNQRAQGNKPSSIFQTGRDRDYIVMRIQFRSSSDYQLRYDYAGMMAGVNFPRAPIWFESGFAEFFALSEIEDTKAKIGQASPRYVQKLAKSPLIPLPKFFILRTSSEEYKDPEQRWVFDAEAWGLFHYLMLADNGAHRAQLIAYLDLLAHGKKRLDAAQEAFGDLKKLQDKIGSYYMQKAFPFVQLDLARENFTAQISTRSLTQAESSAWLAEYHIRSKRQAIAKSLVDAALAANPNEPRAHEALGLYDLELADYENAAKEFSEATAHDPSLYLSFYYGGILSSYWKAPAQIPPSSEQDLRRSLQITPKYAPAALAIARLIVRMGGNPYEAADFARRAADADPGIPRFAIAYANILLLAGERSRAQDVARQALESELSPLEEESANSILQIAEACKPGSVCKGLGHLEFSSPAESPTDSPAAPSAAGSASPDTAAKLYRLGGVVRTIACNSDGRVITFASGDKDLKFDAIKTTRFSWPETFWLDPAYLNVCKHFAGEPAAIKYKSAASDSSAPDAISLEIQDRF